MATNQPPPKKKGVAPAAGGGGNFLTKKAGPLPVWGYIVVAVAAYLIYKKLQGSSSSTSGTAATTGVAPATETVTTPYGSYSGPAQGGIPQSILSGPSTPTPGPTTTPGGGGPTPGNGGTTTTGTTPVGTTPVADNVGGATWVPAAGYAQTFGPLYTPAGLNAGLPAGYSNAASLGIPQTGAKTSAGGPG